MALPSDLYSLSVTGSYKDAAGFPAAGRITFTPSGWLPDSVGNVTVTPFGRTYSFTNGAFTTDPLVANDNADLPANSTYIVKVELANLQPFSYSVQLLAAPFSFTATNATPCVFTATGSAYANGTAVMLTGASVPAGFTAGTTYYVVSASGTAFSLAATSGGSAIASTGTGSGTVSTASVDISDLQPVVSQGTPVSYVPSSGGTYTGTVVFDGSPAIQIPSGGAAGQVFTSDSSGNGVWAAPALVVKPEVQEATATALPANAYASGVLTASANGALTVDGIAVTAGDRVLVKNEATAANNGVYVATSAGASGAKYVLTRSADMNIAADIPGAFVFAQQGTQNGNTGWMVTGAGPWTLGSTAINWAQFSAIPALGLLTPTAVKTANYTAASGDLVKTDTSGGSFTVTLPTAPAVNTTIGVKMVTVAGLGTNATTIAAGGSDVFNKSGGPASFTLDRLNQTVIMQYGSGAVWTVLNTDPATGQIATARDGIYYLDTFTGTDDQKMTSALSAVVTAGGGIIQLSPRAHTFASQWSTSYTGATPAIGIKIRGAGASPMGDLGNPPTGATQVTFTYSSSGAGQVDFQHQGSYEITGIYFRDTTVSSVPFIFSTNPQPLIHDNVFTGTGTGATCAKDAIVLGGNGGFSGSGDTAKFNGYGGDIHHNYFDCIRHPAVFQGGCNAMQVHNNTIATTCGDAAAGMPVQMGAPFVFSGNATNGVTGVQIHDNLIEAVHYRAVARANASGYAVSNTIGPNTCWDTGSLTPLAVMDSTSSGNFVNDLAYGVDTQPVFEGAGGTGILTGRLNQGGVSHFGQNVIFDGLAISRSANTGFITESYNGGKIFMEAIGPSVTGRPPAAAVGYLNSTNVTDGSTITGTPYASSLTAAWTVLDAGVYITSGTSAIPSNTKILWVYLPTSQAFITWQASTAYTLGQFTVPATSNGHLYQCTTAGTTSSSAPTFPTGGGTVTDGSVVWQDLGASTGVQLSQNCTATTTGNTLFFGRSSGSNVAMTQFLNHHVNGSGTAPTYAVNAAVAGTGATVVVSSGGFDIGHQVNLTAGTSPGTGLLCTGTPGNTMYASAGVIAITPVSANAVGLGLYGDLRATSTWKINCTNAPTAAQTYIFNVITLG